MSFLARDHDWRGRARRNEVDDIKVSRGEENIFIWCFFLAIVQLVLDGDEAYKWVKYVYIDDPISSLDENNAIAVANHLAQMLTSQKKGRRTVVSSHHVLFFNVLCNELKTRRTGTSLRRARRRTAMSFRTRPASRSCITWQRWSS